MRLIDADKLNIYDVSPAYGTCVMGVTEEDIELAPTVDAEPVRHARLINAHPYGECSCCGELIDSRDRFRYCPHCGAMLVVEGEKDETNKCG